MVWGGGVASGEGLRQSGEGRWLGGRGLGVSPPPQEAPPPLRCPRCPVAAHPPCLARHFLRSDPAHLLPVGGDCPG